MHFQVNNDKIIYNNTNVVFICFIIWSNKYSEIASRLPTVGTDGSDTGGVSWF